jgi:hypothetical protein
MRKDLITAIAATAFFAVPSLQAAGDETKDVPVLFLADAQIHNVYGVSLRQMVPAADWVSKVAIRPPELNLLAPLTLRYALETGQARLPDADKFVVMLGDGTNIGCSGEADVFDTEFTRPSARAGTLRLVAHGNHDSYMMGTLNSFSPAAADAAPLDRTMKEALPVDDSWWKPTDAPVVTGTSLAHRNWMDACYKPAEDAGAGTPMNKLRWLARYARSLAPFGLEQKADGAMRDALKFVGTARSGSPLADLNYRTRGQWYRPTLQSGHHGYYYPVAWKSFEVQAADISDHHTLVLIDTSVCASANAYHFLGTNAGQNGCIGQAQFEVISQMLAEVPASRAVILAGHFPLKELSKAERDQLIAIMSKRSPSGWTYVSAHTHDPMSDTSYSGGVERNIGSTTDWPMESHVIHFDAADAKIARTESTVFKDNKDIPPLDYSLHWPLAGSYSELCRHLNAAEALAKADSSQFDRAWNSPGPTADSCRNIQAHWRENAKALIGYQQRISERFDKEKDYRRFVLRLAAGASRWEHGQAVTGIP